MLVQGSNGLDTHCEVWFPEGQPRSSLHYSDVIMSAMESQITGISIIY